MALLIDIGLPGWMKDEELHAILAPLLPGVKIYCGTPTSELADVKMIAVSGAVPDVWHLLPNVLCVQKLGAGVDLIVVDPKIPAHVRVTRMAPAIQAVEIAEYCLAAVLMFQRNFIAHNNDASRCTWRPLAPRKTVDAMVTVLGLGHIGRRVAELFVSLGFRVKGWSRRQKSLHGLQCFSGVGQLAAALNDSDYVVSILPSTTGTRDLINRSRLQQCKPGAVLINVGRGDLIVESDLLDALDRGHLSGAVLDVFRQEPLPTEHPFWSHEKVFITPHVSNWHIDGGFDDVADNYRRVCAGEPLLHEVDRRTGY